MDRELRVETDVEGSSREEVLRPTAGGRRDKRGAVDCGQMAWGLES